MTRYSHAPALIQPNTRSQGDFMDSGPHRSPFPRLGERTLSGFGVRRPGGFSPESGEGVINGVRIVDAMIQGMNGGPGKASGQC